MIFDSVPKARTLFGIVVLAAAYFVAGKLGLTLSLVADNVTLIWPPTGLALASLLLFGPRLWPGVLLGSFVLNFTTAAPLLSAAGIALGNTGEALAGYWLLTRVARIDPALPRVRDALRLIVVGGGIATMVSASIGVASLVGGGVIPAAAASSAWAVWWMGDAMGAIVFGPVLLAWARAWRLTMSARDMIEAMGFGVVLCLAATVSVGGLGLFPSQQQPLAFLVLPMLIWAAARFGHRGVTLTALVFTLAALWGVLQGNGLFARATATESLTLLWVYANTVAMSGLVLAAFVSELTAAQADRRLAAKVFEHLPTGVVITDDRGFALSANPAYLRLMGLEMHEVLAQDMRQFAAPRHTREELEAIGRTAIERGCWSGEVWNQKANGEVFPSWITVAPAFDEAGDLSHFIVSVSDTTERKQIEERNRELAEHDVLTGLPNRMLLTDRLNQTLLRAARQGEQAAVLFVDLDHFKVINDSLGHDIGDELLQRVAGRLSTCVRDEDTVARQGGDEFVIIVNDVQHDHDAALVAQKVLDGVAEPFEVRGYTLDITASVGIALFPRDGTDATTLLKHADLAMYHGKQGRASYHFYGEEMDRRAQARLTIEARLRRALEQQELLLHYQPQLDAQNGELVGLEALLRWQPADGDLVAPGEFIAIAEETGLILPIGRWVLQEAAMQYRRWSDQGLRVPRIAVNVSARQLWHGDLDTEVQHALAQAGVAASALELELTESIFLRSTEEVGETLTRLHGLGVRLAIDDFGTGYSSLAYLRRLPVDTLKLDRAFVQDLPHSTTAGAIASAVISLANGLGITVVAEGVETESQYAYLRGQRCHQLQGFYFSKPLSVADCAHVLKHGLRNR